MKTFILSKTSSTHNSNEDNYFIWHNDKFQVAVVLDGCSSGIDSYFASKFFKMCLESSIKIFNDCIEISNFADRLFAVVMEIKNKTLDFCKLFDKLPLNEMNFLSTMVFTVYDKETKELYVSFFGDGTIVYKTSDGESYNIVKNDEDNTPEYLAYHIFADYNPPHYYTNILDFVNSRNSYIFDDVVDYSVCSDGIDAIRNNLTQAEQVKPIDYFCMDSNMANTGNMLNKKYNILKNKNAILLNDDLTILRFIADGTI